MKTSIQLAIGAVALTTVLWSASPSMAQPPQRQPPSAWCYYHSCPEDGFGSRTPVTLPGDRHPPSGTNSGIPIGNVVRPEIPQPSHFRPK